MESLFFWLETATAQESFHRHRLRPALNLKVPVAQLLDELNEFSKSRAIETANHDVTMSTPRWERGVAHIEPMQRSTCREGTL